ncbi:MAG: MarR family transcriptional regulator [Rhodospirillaceae bacterium]|nr:MarR family transcriptional regulator [Rhodospirillaceae bacterium]|tara:strand:+ start:12819 stop:13292 length:474 start_codon:yes stop_codon:yes gene_type:complete
MTKTPDKPDAIDMAKLPDLIGYNLRCAQVAVFQHFSKTIGEAEISPPQYGALVLISANPGISQSAIASALRFDRSTLVQIIDRLEDRGLVVREVSATDRRSHALKLTEAGQTLLNDLNERVHQHEQHMTRNLSVDERQTLMSLLARVYKEEADPSSN